MSYLLLIGKPTIEGLELLKELVNDFEDTVWVSTVYSAEKIREIIGKKPWVVDAFSWGMKSAEEKEFVVANPTNLNEISLAVSKVLQDVREDYILILHSISGLAIYQPIAKVINLLRVLLMKIENDKAKAIFTLISGAQERQFEVGTMMFFPNVVELSEREIRVVKSFNPDVDRGDYNANRAKEILMRLLKL
ncbi:MAG: hypothetical protein QXD49_01695 [Archaeoglobaceae archaeon]|uniref:KaiC-like domain-containing protein n=1 Tax=Archaeoglobus fulgidus TaxID=2234 RepID=A0A7J3M3H3_ARCFL